MGNLPISAHITVVSTAPAAPPDASAGLPGGVAPTASTDFSHLLAGQLAARNAVPVEGALGKEVLGKLQDHELKHENTGVEQLALDGLGVAGFIPFAPLAQQHANDAEARAADEAVKRPGLGKLLSAIRDGQPEDSKLDLAAGITEKDGKLPANFAAHAAVLPSEKELRDAVREITSSGERGLKATALPELASGSTSTPSGLMAHGMVAAKTDVPSVQVSTPVVTVASPVGAQAWGAELGQKVVWLANQQLQMAHINVTPPQLGPIEIHLKLASDQANAIFVSPHAAVREAIESALPQLRELLAGSGLNLGNVDVSSQSPGQFGQMQREFANRGNNASQAGAESDSGSLHVGAMAGRATVSGGQGLVDLFA